MRISDWSSDVCSSDLRWRTWLQEKLWGSRESPQAQASLRRELHGLRNMAANSGVPLIESNHRAIRLLLENIEADVHDPRLLLKRGQDFLEGINLPGEEGFAEWLCDMRTDLQSFDLRRQHTTTLNTHASGPHPHVVRT